MDVLCFGGTKNGMAVGEAILFFDRKMAEDFDYRANSGTTPRPRCDSSQHRGWASWRNGAWLRNAAHANASARYLADQIGGIAGVRIVSYPEANAVLFKRRIRFSKLCTSRDWKFYTFIGGAARFMCSWDTEKSRIDEFCHNLRVCAEQATLVGK